MEQKNKNNEKFLHICEVCGKEEVLTAEEAYEQGWDYPPLMGMYGVISPRTCCDCGIQGTVWWALSVEKKAINDLTEKQKETIERILKETEEH